MKIPGTIAAVLFVICTPLLLISLNLGFMVNTNQLYEYGFDKYDIPEVTGIDSDELARAADHLIDYFNGSEDSPQIRVAKNAEEINLFSQREIDHLKDVKGIIQLFYLILWITLGYVVIYLAVGFIIRKRDFLRPLMKRLFQGGILTITLFAFVGIWALIDFDSLFLRFHLTSFQNDLWQLDPSQDYLIMMFPEGFFSDAALLLVGDTVLEAMILIGASWLYLRRNPPPQLQEAQLPDEQPAQELPPPTGTDTPPESLANEANIEIDRSAP